MLGIALSLTTLASASATTLRMSSWFPSQHPLMTEGLEPWTKQIEAVTEGRVKVRILKKTIGNVAGQFDVVTSGQAHIAFGNQSYTPGRFKQYGFIEFPGAGNQAASTSVAYWNTYNQYFKESNELSDATLLALFTHGPGQLFLNEQPLGPVENNRGIKVRGGGISATRAIDAMGMTSVQAPFSKMAEMISSGVVDGAMLDQSVVPTFGFQKYFKKRLVVDGGLFNVSYFVVMNTKKWESLSVRDRQAIESISGVNLARKMGGIWDKQGELANLKLQDLGVETITAPQSLIDSLHRESLAHEQSWIEEMEKQGIDGAAALTYFRQEVKRIESSLLD